MIPYTFFDIAFRKKSPLFKLFQVRGRLDLLVQGLPDSLSMLAIEGEGCPPWEEFHLVGYNAVEKALPV